MDLIHIIIGVVLVIVVLEIVKHLFFKKTAKLVLIVFVTLILFLAFSYAFKDVDKFQDNKFVQTGAVVTGELVDIFKEKIDTKDIINSTVKSNKLFKS